MKNIKNFLVIFLVSVLFSGCTNLDENSNTKLEIKNGNNEVKDTEKSELVNDESEEFISLSLEQFEEIVSNDLSNYEIYEDGCFEFEMYDAEYDECVIEYECLDDLECSKFDDLFEKYLDKIENEDFGEEFSDVDIYHSESENHGESNQEITLSSYDISNGEILNKNDLSVSSELVNLQQKEEIHNDMFKEFSRLIPVNIFEKDLIEYKVFTDGVDNTLGYVSQIEGNSDKWFLALDINDYNIDDLKEFQYTLIHEYAHILSLNKNQLEYGVYEDECNTYYLDEGCSRDNSYVLKYYNEFWKDVYGTYENVDYFENENDFTTDYAATNPVEDLAESFTHFVLNKKNENPTLVKENKVNFFYQYDELVELRSKIRMQLSKTKRLRVQ